MFFLLKKFPLPSLEGRGNLSLFRNSSSILSLPYSLRQQARKAFRLLDGHIGEHFSVYGNTGLLQPVHELAIGDPVSSAGGIYTEYPETTHVAFSFTPVKIGIRQRVYHRLGSAPNEPVLGAPVPFGQGQDFLMSVV